MTVETCGDGLGVRRRRRRHFLGLDNRGGGVRESAGAVEAASLQPSPRRHFDVGEKRADVNDVYDVFVAAERVEEGEVEECQCNGSTKQKQAEVPQPQHAK